MERRNKKKFGTLIFIFSFISLLSLVTLGAVLDDLIISNGGDRGSYGIDQPGDLLVEFISVGGTSEKITTGVAPTFVPVAINRYALNVENWVQKAGEPFDMEVAALNVNGAVITSPASVNSRATFSLTSSSPETTEFSIDDGKTWAKSPSLRLSRGRASVKVKDRKAGDLIIIAMDEAGKTGSSEVIDVLPGPLAAVVSSKEKALVGDTVQLNATDEYGNPIPGVLWSSSREEVAKVSSEGVMRAIAGGTTVIEATSGEISKGALIKVFIDGSKGGIAAYADEIGVTEAIIPEGALSGIMLVDIRPPDEWEVKPQVENLTNILAFAQDFGDPDDIDSIGMDIIRQFTVLDENGEVVRGTFDKDVEMRISYPDRDGDRLVDGTDVKEENLRIYWLNDQIDPPRWEEVLSSHVDPEMDRVVAFVSHFSIYKVEGKLENKIPSGVGYVAVYPNPYHVSTGGELTFINLPSPKDLEYIKIYNLAGELVHEIDKSDVVLSPVGGKYSTYTANWDGATVRGRRVAGGIYFYVVMAKNSDKPKIGKIGVVK